MRQLERHAAREQPGMKQEASLEVGTQVNELCKTGSTSRGEIGVLCSRKKASRPEKVRKDKLGIGI